MSVEIGPQELAFQRPFNVEVTQTLRIKNPNRQPVAFKVKTTAPKQYCVRPNSGRIEPGKEVDVTVILQPMKQEPAPDAKCRDKFLVQSVAISPEKEFDNPNSLWQHTEEDKDAVQEKKIRVVYTPAASAPTSAQSAAVSTPVKNGINGLDGAHSEQAPPAYTTRSPSPEQTFTPDNRPSTAASTIKQVEPPKVKAEPKPSSPNVASSPSLATAIANTPTMSYDDMKAKLAEAQATIANYAEQGGLRMRKVAKGETGNNTVDSVAQQVQATQGVPLQIVAALCLVSFLLAYLFF